MPWQKVLEIDEDGSEATVESLSGNVYDCSLYDDVNGPVGKVNSNEEKEWWGHVSFPDNTDSPILTEIAESKESPPDTRKGLVTEAQLEKEYSSGGYSIEPHSQRELVKYLDCLLTESEWDVQNVSHGLSDDNPLSHHAEASPPGEDITVNFVCHYTDSAGAGGAFAKVFRHLFALDFANGREQLCVLVTEVEGNHDPVHGSDWMEYFCNHLGIGYMDIDRGLGSNEGLNQTKITFNRRDNEMKTNILPGGRYEPNWEKIIDKMHRKSLTP